MVQCGKLWEKEISVWLSLEPTTGYSVTHEFEDWWKGKVTAQSHHVPGTFCMFPHNFPVTKVTPHAQGCIMSKGEFPWADFMLQITFLCHLPELNLCLSIHAGSRKKVM